MLTTELLARTVQADRERDLRERRRGALSAPSGPRHPQDAGVLHPGPRTSRIAVRPRRSPAPAA